MEHPIHDRRNTIRETSGSSAPSGQKDYLKQILGIFSSRFSYAIAIHCNHSIVACCWLNKVSRRCFGTFFLTAASVDAFFWLKQNKELTQERKRPCGIGSCLLCLIPNRVWIIPSDNLTITMENHHVCWQHPVFQWQFYSIFNSYAKTKKEGNLFNLMKIQFSCYYP